MGDTLLFGQTITVRTHFSEELNEEQLAVATAEGVPILVANAAQPTDGPRS